jgi:hypothetical protein
VVTGSSDGPDGLGDVVTVKYRTDLGTFADGFESGGVAAW